MIQILSTHRQNGSPYPGFGSGLLFNGIMCILFGFVVLIAPELLAYLIAIVLIFIGGSLLSVWWRIRSTQK
jgi:uncharacterized membrane protein HdeD (DUF308 family)